MKDETKQLQDWYRTVGDDDLKEAWARSVMSDPENGLVFTRLANCAGHSVEMMLRLASLDKNPETASRVRESILDALNRPQ